MGKLKAIEHGIKAAVFNTVAVFLKRGDRAFQPLDGKQLKRVLFLRPEKIGDMVISLPVFDALRRAHPQIEQSILASPRNIALISDDPRFAHIFLYRKNILRDLREVLKMRRETFDCVVDMICDDSVTALFLSQLCAPGKPRIGVGKVKFRRYYDFNYDHRMENTGHIIQNTLALLKAFGLEPVKADPYARPYISPSDLELGREFVAELRRTGSRPRVIGYNLSAGSPTRIWEESKSVELVRRLVARDDATQIALLTTPGERQRALSIQRQVGSHVAIVPDRLTLLQASAIVAHLDLLISPDTSMIHIARSFHVPVVGLYSRFMKNFLLWKPYGQEHGAVLSGNDDNIFDITVEQVMAGATEVLSDAKAGSPK